MKILINGFDHKSQIALIRDLKTKLSPERLIWIVGSRDEIEVISNITSDFLIVSEIINGYYPSGKELKPLDNEIINKMQPYESAIMRQMDRFEVYLKRRITYDERREIYYRHLRYWNNILMSEKFNFYIGANIPHDIYDYVIFGLCNVYKIKTLFFYQSQIKDIIHPMTDWKNFTSSVPKTFDSYIKEFKSWDIDEISLSPHMLNEWNNLKEDVIPFYMKNQKFGLTNLIKKSVVIFKRVLVNEFSIRGVSRMYQNYKLNKIYENLCSHPNFNKKYFYFPLHYQPELTSCPLGESFVDQFLILQLLDYYLPNDYVIYIKEHPKQGFASRHYGYYQNFIDSSSKVSLVSKSISSFDLIKNSKGVITISGTAGWEALFRNKPVLLFGHNFYQCAPGVFQIKTLSDCENAIHQICGNEFNCDQKALKLFMKAIDENSIKGFIDTAYSGVSNFSAEESRKNIHDFIDNFINTHNLFESQKNFD